MSDKYHVGLGVFGIYAGILKNKEAETSADK
jgi:hypothetical protein